MSLSRVAFTHQRCHRQHLLRQPFEAEGSVFMWFCSRKKAVNGLSGKEGMCSPRGAFRNTPVARREGFAVTTSFSIRVQKSIAFLRDHVLCVTAKTKAHSREASQNMQQIQCIRASTEKFNLMQSKDFQGRDKHSGPTMGHLFPKEHRLNVTCFPCTFTVNFTGKCQL